MSNELRKIAVKYARTLMDEIIGKDEADDSTTWADLFQTLTAIDKAVKAGNPQPSVAAKVEEPKEPAKKPGAVVNRKVAQKVKNEKAAEAVSEEQANLAAKMRGAQSSRRG